LPEPKAMAGGAVALQSSYNLLG